MNDCQKIIEEAYEKLATITPKNCDAKVKAAVGQVIEGLNAGKLRVAEKHGKEWKVNQWLKKAVLVFFRINENSVMDGYYTKFYDKVPTKYEGYEPQTFQEHGVRVVPPAVVRTGAYVASSVVLMPSFVNIGAYVDSGTMVDTWATVGSCAQIGKNVHLSGGVGIGGVLEPPGAVPVVVEDDAFIGSRSMVVDGARVRTGAKLGAGTILTATTHVIDTSTGEELPRGEAPAWSVCVSGTRVRSFPGGDFGMPCVLVLRRLAEGSGHDRLALNEILRDHGVSG